MYTLENDRLRISLSSGGLLDAVHDRLCNVAWQSLGDHGWRHIQDGVRDLWNRTPDTPARPLPVGRVQRQCPTAIQVTHPLPDGAIIARYALEPDHLAISISVDSPTVAEAVLPGSLAPAEGGERLLVPRFQGAYFDATGVPGECFAVQNSHEGFTLPMLAVETPAGALLVSQETETDWAVRWGEREDGRLFAAFAQRRCPANGWFDRELRIYPTDPDVTAIAKCFRRRVIARGHFRTWAEKIERKPILEKLFGCCIAFTGYSAAPSIDYPANAQRMRDYGFSSVLYFPVRMFQRTIDFTMGGDPPIWLSDETIAAIHRVEGALVSPWAWTVECRQDGTPGATRAHAHDADGHTCLSWKIDDQRWVRTCPPYQIEEMHAAWKDPLAAMDWVHYDVNANIPGVQCFRTDHTLHANRPIGSRETFAFYRELLDSATNGNRIVSSEGFNPSYAAQYDIGTVKSLPRWGRKRWTSVPLTMLVYHDCLVHDWWELHGYTELPSFRPPPDNSAGPPRKGCGQGALKAATDALYGCPPNVFPFGRQYYWVGDAWEKTASFALSFDDQAVQTSLAQALPVARLHARTGREEMLSFRFLSDDCAVQETLFANGIRVTANFSDTPREAPGLAEPLAPESWLARNADA